LHVHTNIPDTFTKSSEFRDTEQNKEEVNYTNFGKEAKVLNAVQLGCKKVDKIRPIGVRFLGNALNQQEDLLVKIKGGKEIAVNTTYGSDTTPIEKNIEVIRSRINVDKQYAALLVYFNSDQKRSYMVNRNYLNYLRAIIFLYQTSKLSVSAGVYTAPAEIYQTITLVQESFKEMVASLSHK